MPLQKPIKIVKVSNGRPDVDYPKRFERQKRLYLELMENKTKIKQDLINKEYIPQDIKGEKPELKSTEGVPANDKKSISISDITKTPDTRERVSKSVSNETYESYKSKSTTASPDSSNSSNSDDLDSSLNKSSDSLEDRLKELLNDGTENVVKKSKYTPYEPYKEEPPTLAELKKTGHFQINEELRDMNQVPLKEYEQEDKKRELLFKFELLKKSYPLSVALIPSVTEFTDYQELQKVYDSTIRRLSLDSTVESYKSYLIGGFMVVEMVFGNFLGFDMQGFTQQQLLSINSYERLLIELGEKSYVPAGSKWPVELRLLFLVIINAGVFIVGKMIMKKTGSNLMNMMNNVTQPPLRPKRRMQGPSVNIPEDDVSMAEQPPKI